MTASERRTGAHAAAAGAGMLTISPPLLASADIVVVGAGSAGACAAIAAARHGASVVLIEKQAFLGGTSTAVLDTFYGFYTPGSRALKVAGGLSDEVVAGLRVLGPVLERPNTYGAGTGVTYNAEHLKLVWERLATEAGVRICCTPSCRMSSSATVGSPRCWWPPRRGSSASRGASSWMPAGTPTSATTPASATSWPVPDRRRRRSRRRSGWSTWISRDADTSARPRSTSAWPRRPGPASTTCLGARECDHITPVEGMIATVMTRIDAVGERDGAVVNATDPTLLAEAEMAGRRQAFEYARFLRDRIPGYEDAALVWLSSQIGVRETRRVFGDARLTREDVLGARRFDDEIGLCGAPIEDHRPGVDTRWQYLPDGEVVGIPYGTLVVRDASNALVAGRCFSATHDAHASVRSMAQTMAMGQAAGTAAALALESADEPRAVDAAVLRDRLRADGAVLDLPTRT